MRRLSLSVVVMLLMTWAIRAQVSQITNDRAGQPAGANLTEIILNTANVTVSGFGKLYSYQVDGPVSGQPWYAAGVTVNGSRHNVLYVATIHHKLYAFDADAP